MNGLSFCSVLSSSVMHLELGQPFDTVQDPAKSSVNSLEKAEQRKRTWALMT